MTDNDEITKKKPSRVQSSMLVWVLMALLITGLGGFGVTNFGRSSTSIGSVGTQDIEINAYAQALRSQINGLSQQFGKQLSFAEAQMFGIDQQVLSSLIANAALDNEANRIGVSVGDKTVAQNIAAVQAFQDVTGKFSKESYTQRLEQIGMTVREFETGIRQETARQVLQAAVVGGVVAPAALTDTLFAYNGETRGFSVLALTEASLPSPLPAATDTDLKAHYDSHIADYTRGEAKRLTYVALQPDAIASTMPVDEAALKALYDSRSAEYIIPEKRLVERLVYPDDAAAAAAKAKLDAGTSFEDLTKERGLELADIDLGDVTKQDLGPAGETIFAMTAPGVVGPLQSDLGPALYRMNGILAAQETTLDQARDKLALELQTEAAVRAIAEKTSAIDDALAGGATLEDLVASDKMVLGTLDFVAGASDNDAIANDPGFAAAANKVAVGDYPELIQLANGGLAALRLDSTVPPTPLPFDKVKDKVTAAFKAAELAKALTVQGTAALAAVTGGAALSTQGVVSVIPPATRDTVPSGLTADVVTAAFAMAKDEIRLIDTPDFVGLVQLTSITPADATSDTGKVAREALAAQAAQSVAQDAYDLFTNAMTKEGGLTLDQTAINAVQARMN